MPWRIQQYDTNLNETLHLIDRSVDLHMVTDLKSGVIDLFIGNSKPEEADIHIEIDADRAEPVEVVYVSPSTQNKQISIIGNVLSTMGAQARDYRALISQIREENQAAA